MRKLLLYHDFTSPFCRVAFEQALRLEPRLEATLLTLPYQLRPSPDPLPSADAAELRTELEAARPLAREVDLALERPATVPRTLKAHEAVVHARRHGRDLDLAGALYDAYWVDGADIGRVDVLADAGAAAGLDRQALHVALGLDEEAEAVAELEARAQRAGITGVPTLVVDDRVLVGLLPLRELFDWAAAGG